MRGRSCHATGILSMLLLSILAPTTLAVEDAPQVVASAYRFDLGGLAPGETTEGAFELANPGKAPIEVRLVHDGAGPYFVTATPERLTLAAGAREIVRFVYGPPLEAAPGDHADALVLLASPADADAQADSAGSLTAGQAIVFTGRTLAVGFSAIESPETVLPGERLTGRLLVVNTALEPVLARVAIAVHAPDGRALLRQEGDELHLGSGDAAAFRFDLGAVELARGDYELRATFASLDPADAPTPRGAFTKRLVVGSREARVTLDALRDEGDGNATVALNVTNTGTVPLTLQPRLSLVPETGNGSAELDLEALLLEPGESRVLHASLRVPPGNYTVRATLRGIGVADVAVEDAHAPFTLRAPAAPEPGFDLLASLSWARVRPYALAGGALLALALVGAGVVALARWARARLPREPRRLPTARQAPPPPEPAQAGEGVALLVDLCTLVPEPWRAPLNLEELRATVSLGRPVTRALAYYEAATSEEASLAFHALQRAGFEPRVRVGPRWAAPETRQAHLQLALDALEAAQHVGTLVVATHDAALAPLLRRLRDDGARVEVAGTEGGIPFDLLLESDASHLVGGATAGLFDFQDARLTR